MATRKQQCRVARGLAAALLAGAWDETDMAALAAVGLGRKWRWRWPLIRRLLARFADPPPLDTLARCVLGDQGFLRAMAQPERPKVHRWFTVHTAMASTREAWGLPVLDTVADLQAWLRPRHSRTCAVSGWMRAWPGLRAAVERSTRVMPTISSSLATRLLLGASLAFDCSSAK